MDLRIYYLIDRWDIWKSMSIDNIIDNGPRCKASQRVIIMRDNNKRTHIALIKRIMMKWKEEERTIGERN